MELTPAENSLKFSPPCITLSSNSSGRKMRFARDVKVNREGNWREEHGNHRHRRR